MKVKCREQDGAVILEVSGDMHGGPENVEIVNILDRLGEEGKLNAILDLKKVRYIASNGLGILVRARAHYVAHGGRFCICNATSRGLSIIYVTKLHLIFDMHDSREDALEAVRS